ncbi:MAG: response regulator [Acidobacteria bacterium]|jgi:sigma-B regulation protein RsbU (phosphoserine phosphatase)|nr:response regulator [Acidobacteriota bacterium]
MRILIADDEKMICELLTEALQPLGHEVFSASNGLEALRMFEQISPGIVILDITMPGLDGYGVLSQIRRIGAAPRVFVLMLTGRSQLEELERSLQSGADDYLPKPFHLRELVARVQAAVRMRTLQEELQLRNQQLAEANEALAITLAKEERLNRKMALEMEVAARLQKGILSPARLDLGRVRAFACYQPSLQIGGDFYDLRALGSGNVSIFLADAVGHGVSAAILAAMLKIAFEDSLASHFLPSEILAALNRSFQFCSEHGKYLTAFCGMLDCETGHMIYSLAGHVPPLAYRHASHSVEKLHPSGFCLGIFEEGLYKDNAIDLAPGDRLFAYTDGISDASLDDRNVFGAQFPELLQRCAELENEDFLHDLNGKFRLFLANSDPTDDYTLLSLRYLPGAA